MRSISFKLVDFGLSRFGGPGVGGPVGGGGSNFVVDVEFAGHGLDEVGEGAVLLHHFLVVTAALVRIPAFDLFAHHDVYLHVLFVGQTQIEQIFMIFQELNIPLVLFHSPVVIRGIHPPIFF